MQSHSNARFQARSHFFAFLLIVATLMAGLMRSPAPVNAQQPSVMVQVQVAPPYSPYLSDYTTAPNKLLVRLVNTSQTMVQVRLAGTITGTNGVRITIPTTFIPSQPIVLPPGGMVQLTQLQLSEYLNPSILQITGITTQEIVLGNGLPESTYQVCFQALDFMTGQPVSQMAPAGCAPPFAVTNYEPPLLLQPFNEASVISSFPQAVLFSWSVPAGAPPAQVDYILRIVEIFPQNADPNLAILTATTPRLFERQVDLNNYLYGPADPPLEVGKRYAYQVVAVPAPGANLVFKNGGRSLTYVFTYGRSTPMPVVTDSVQTAPPKPIAKPAIVLPKPLVRATGVEANGVERSVVEIRVEEFLSRKLHPFLNYLFFNATSAVIPARYVTLNTAQAAEFSPLKLYNKETIDVHHSMLNIVGYRLKQQPSESITIVGCLSQSEKGNTTLALQRAQVVRNYLQKIWGIDTTRLVVQARELPEKPTLSDVNPGPADAENRRVEILGSWNVLQTVAISDTLREATPPTIRFYTDVKTDPAYKDWNITATQNNRELRRIASTRTVPPYVDWRINREKNTVPIDTAKLGYQLTVGYDTVGSAASDPAAMPVQQVTIQKKRRERVNDVEKDRYSVVLFDVGSDKITDNIQKVIDFIKAEGRIKATSRVIITGYTDNLIGSDAVNVELSKRRADAVATALGVTKDNVKELVVTGMGGRDLLYDTDEPEGRFYCRTVLVEVENPVVQE
jgi:TANFOR domain-containing protein